MIHITYIAMHLVPWVLLRLHASIVHSPSLSCAHTFVASTTGDSHNSLLPNSAVLHHCLVYSDKSVVFLQYHDNAY